jgi:hypothetical protein
MSTSDDKRRKGDADGKRTDGCCSCCLFYLLLPLMLDVIPIPFSAKLKIFIAASGLMLLIALGHLLSDHRGGS